ncbi:MAG: SUMF1/EgtB/PvdO family nonheme iron enzyme, partial [Luteolibacter sp.]
RNRITAWLADERGLTVKPEPRINRADRGMDFLGLRVFPHTVRLNHRRKIRFLRRLRGLHAAGRYTGLPARRAFSQRKQSGRRPNGSNRVICGGSWNNNANNARCANRNNNWPNNASNNNGFRMARVQPDPRMPQARG